MPLPSLLVAALLALAGGDGGAPEEPESPPLDVVDLGGGRVVVGRLVKETAEALYVDIGPTIVRVPRDAVVAVRAAGEAPAGSDGAVAAEGAPEGAIWHSSGTPAPAAPGGGPEASVRAAVERVAEGVVLVKVPGALGSGFVLHEDGWIVTNAHVVQGERRITVTVLDETPAGFEKRVLEDVEIVALNPYWDLALLRVPREVLGELELSPVPLAEPDAVRAGETVFAVGNPLGLERSVSEGIVSTTRRASEGMLYLQTTAAINPGNSGGPLFDLRGEVVGVTTWGYLGTEGLGFAVPVGTLRTFLASREAFAYDADQPNTGVRYLAPPRKGAAAAAERGTEQ